MKRSHQWSPRGYRYGITARHDVLSSLESNSREGGSDRQTNSPYDIRKYHDDPVYAQSFPLLSNCVSRLVFHGRLFIKCHQGLTDRILLFIGCFVVHCDHIQKVMAMSNGLDYCIVNQYSVNILWLTSKQQIFSVWKMIMLMCCKWSS